MSGVGTAGQALDVSGLGNHLAANGDPQFSYENLAPIAILDGNDYFSITDATSGSAFDFIGTAAAEPYIAAAALGMTLNIWVKFDNAPGANENIISKWAGAGTRSYQLRRLAAGGINFRVSSDGTNVAATVTSVATFAANTWIEIAARFIPGVEVALFTNGTKETAATATASLFNTAADFVIGANSVGATPVTGRVSSASACIEQHSDALAGSVFEQTRAMFGVR